MANKSVFVSIKGRLLPQATAVNAHAAPAYAYSDAHSDAPRAFHVPSPFVAGTSSMQPMGAWAFIQKKERSKDHHRK